MAQRARLVRDVRERMKADNVSLVAAGIAFYGMLAMFPALIATITLYGLIADPDRIRTQLADATAALPQGAADVITGQLSAVTQVGGGGLALGLVVSLIATVWAASGGVRALLLGLNVIFQVREGRSLVRWVLLVGLVLVGLGVLYRWGPDRATARWRWVTVGALVALAGWGWGSIAFSVYVSNFGSYNETYGSLAAVIVLMLWLYLSALAILVGAEVDAIRERDKDVIHTTPPSQ